MAAPPNHHVCPEEGFIMLPSSRDSPSHSMPEIFRLGKCRSIDVHEISVDELQHHYSSGVLSSYEYVDFCLGRVQAINPYLECVIETNPDALEIAASLDREREQGRVRGPLHGVPVLVKDNMATADKMQTTAGSWALLGSIVPKDAHVVHLLRENGAVILGKTNLDEWAGMRGSVYALGYSARGGQCRNPYMLNRSPNGSSSGSAVSVSANIVPLAFGTETDCSVISPAMVSGVVAIKPTVGLTSRGGVIPISDTQDSVGPFGRCVADVARALDVIAGPDPDDKFSTVPGRHQPKSYYSHLTDRHALKGARFGLPMKCFWEAAPFPQRLVAETVLELIRLAGAEIVPVDMPCAEERLGEHGDWDWERYGETNPSVSEITVSKVQTYALMNTYLSQLKNTPMKSLEDIVRYNDENCGSEGGHAGDLPAFPDGQRLFRKCVETKGVKDEVYYAALKHITSQCRENGIDAALEDPASGTQDNLGGPRFADFQDYLRMVKDRFSPDRPELYSQFVKLLNAHLHNLSSCPEASYFQVQAAELFTSANEDLLQELDRIFSESTAKNAYNASSDMPGKSIDTLDALLFNDVKASGIQIAAQAGYPVLTIPIGLDPDGMPVPLTLQHSAWQEGRLIKWASAIEDLLKHCNEEHGIGIGSRNAVEERSRRLGRIEPLFMNHLRKNIPTDLDWRWPGRERQMEEARKREQQSSR